MDFDDLEDLGFERMGARDDPHLSAELMTPIANPVSRQFISRAVFRLQDGRLVPVEPPELVGLPPLSTEGLTRMSDVSARLQDAFDEFILRLERRSEELLALGLEPRVDPETLELSCDVWSQELWIRIAADRAGRFYAVAAARGEEAIEVPPSAAFELSEFRDAHALVGFLEALVTGGAEGAAPATWSPAEDPAPPPAPAEAPAEPRTLTVGDLSERFGGFALVPARTPVEVVVDVRVGGVPHRFAASRLTGTTFRGLLAGPSGKVWAGRFELDEFPGVPALVARELGVDEEFVEVVGAG